jgi:hypothetical protein
MKILRTEYLVRRGEFGKSEELEAVFAVVKEAIQCVHWPPNSDSFILYPMRKGNGVGPIKKSCMVYLREHGWRLEERMKIVTQKRPGKVDAIRTLKNGRIFAVEWETGNVSSSHRAINKLCVGLLSGVICGGILIVPSRAMYNYLTDRVGNFEELEPYFPVWKTVIAKDGVLALIVIEHDGVSNDVPRILKGTDGRALR